MPESLSQLDPTSQVAEVERHDTHSNERHQKDNGEVLHLAFIEFRAELNHCDLPREAAYPDEGKEDADAVHLVVDQLVVLIHLEYERIVDVVAAEYLNGEPRRKQDEAND